MISVSEDGRFLVHGDGSPFLWLGDTGWTLLQRLLREEADEYLRDRAAKGFNVIQVMGISEFDGLSVSNRYGDLPLEDGDPERPNDAYWEHVDWVVDRAGSLGITTALLPTWADKVGPTAWGTEREVFTPQNAGQYGEYLGRRYTDSPVIWVLGGDRNPTEERHFATWRAMVEGLERGGGRQIKTFHPQGGASSSEFFHGDPWLSFNIQQSGHGRRDLPNYARITRDRCLLPTKPCLDAEPSYEDHPVTQATDGAYFGAYDARKAAYRALLAGACGHTYGANGVFQFWDGEREDRFGVRRHWREALQLPGAAQMRHARALLESRPLLSLVPDQGLLLSDPGAGPDHARAARASDGAYALVYLPTARPVSVDLGALSGETIVASWYDPRDGASREAGRFPKGEPFELAPPTSGPEDDWVLVLDDAARGFGPPGAS